jgi:hypothetical protein
MDFPSSEAALKLEQNIKNSDISTSKLKIRNEIIIII